MSQSWIHQSWISRPNQKIQCLTASNNHPRTSFSLFESIEDNDKMVKQMIYQRTQIIAWDICHSKLAFSDNQQLPMNFHHLSLKLSIPEDAESNIHQILRHNEWVKSVDLWNRIESSCSVNSMCENNHSSHNSQVANIHSIHAMNMWY
jgi:hypothetical protein